MILFDYGYSQRHVSPKAGNRTSRALFLTFAPNEGGWGRVPSGAVGETPKENNQSSDGKGPPYPNHAHVNWIDRETSSISKTRVMNFLPINSLC